jgi:hypothetical protein
LVKRSHQQMAGMIEVRLPASQVAPCQSLNARRLGFSAFKRISRTALRVAFAVQSARSKNSDRLHMC